MRRPHATPKKVEVIVTLPGEDEEDADQAVHYTFVDIEQASLSTEVTTRGLTWSEREERGWPILEEHVITGSKVVLELTTKKPEPKT